MIVHSVEAGKNKYPVKEYGWYKLDTYYNPWNFIAKIGETVINNKHTPENGIIQ